MGVSLPSFRSSFTSSKPSSETPNCSEMRHSVFARINASGLEECQPSLIHKAGEAARHAEGPAEQLLDLWASVEIALVRQRQRAQPAIGVSALSTVTDTSRGIELLCLRS